MQWNIAESVQLRAISKSFDEFSTKLFMSRNFFRPLKEMREKVASVIAGKDSNRDQLRYLSYSAHDSNTIAVLLFLNPLEYSPVDQPPASAIVLELHYNATCVEQTRSETCFWVEVLNNGWPLELDTCLEGNRKRGNSMGVCRYDDFVAHIEKRRFSEETDLSALCELPYPRPPRGCNAFLG